jgi:hypothetical protein
MNQAAMFDEDGKVSRDIGVSKALDSAEAANEDWGSLAIGFVTRYLEQDSVKAEVTKFLAEDIREWSHANGLSLPPHPRAWGAIIQKSKSLKLIRKVGFASVKNPKSHSATASQWVRAL